MTRNKNFKSRVRARMKKTGESYTAARAQLMKTSQRPQAPSPSMGATGYQQLGGQHAATAALCNMLAHAGVLAPHTGEPFTEEFLLGLGGGIGAGYFLFQYKDTPPNLFVAGRHSWQDDQIFVKGLLDRLGIAHEFAETGGTKGAQKNLERILHAGKPALAWLDMYRLPGRGMGASCSQNPLLVSLGNSYHLATVIGSDEESSEYLLDDLSDTAIRVDGESLARARAGHKKFKNRLLSLGEPSSPNRAALADAITDAITACIHGLREQRMKNFRVEAIATWAQRAGDRKSKEGWPRIYGDNPFAALVATHSFIRHYGSGGDFFRGMYAEFLNESAEILQQDALHEVADRYDALADQWSELASASLREDVPLFNETRLLLADYWQLSGTRSASSAASLQKKADALLELGRRAEADFPLRGQALDSLYDEIQERLTAIHAAEENALSALQAAVSQ